LTLNAELAYILSAELAHILNASPLSACLPRETGRRLLYLKACELHAGGRADQKAEW